jgi:hypothetical protein
MSNAAFLIRPPKFILAPLVLGVIYTIGIPSFIFLWLGQQYIPGLAGFEKYGLVYALICLVGAICNLAIVRGYAWGVAGQLIVWGSNMVINIILNRGIESYFGLALLLVGFWVFDVYRNRHLLS